MTTVPEKKWKLRPEIIWRTVAQVGFALIIVGLGAGFLDQIPQFHSEFLSDHADDFLRALEIGALLTFIGCIGWAAYLNSQGCFKMAAAALLLPWAEYLLNIPNRDLQVHGPPAELVLLVFPGTLLAVIVGIMALVKRNRNASAPEL